MGGKVRLDMLLVERGLFPSRERARAAVMAGAVTVAGQKVDKPGRPVDSESRIDVREVLPYVSRGGLKLARALQVFKLDLTGRVVLDIGASTGGFTDCALQNGSSRVYAVDVGYGQLAWQLRNDPRVVVLERTNIRHLDPALLNPAPDFVTIDVSFISLGLVLPKVDTLTTPEARGVALIKPQFEAGRSRVGKKGVVKDPAVHEDVINQVLGNIGNLGWGAAGLDYSPVRGPQGNIEYLVYFTKTTPGAKLPDGAVVDTVQLAHRELA